MTVTIRHGDCRDVLRALPDKSVHCCVTSPPYFGLRDYGHAGQIGLEATPDAFVAEMVAVFREVRRVLRDDATLWLVIGDSFSNKQLLGIPWRVAFALQADDWYLRQDIIWSKPNPMPESVTDRCTKAHEYIFLMSKSARYFYDADAIKEEASGRSAGNVGHVKGAGADDPFFKTCEGFANVANFEWQTRNKRSVWEVATQPFSEAHFATFPPELIEPCIKAGNSEHGCCAKCGAPWEREVARNDIDQRTNEVTAFDGVPGLRPGSSGERVRKLSGATYQHVRGGTIGWSPSCSCNAAVIPCTVLDPFAGAGTTGLVADRLQRNAILIELNSEYAEMAERRIRNDAGMFADLFKTEAAE